MGKSQQSKKNFSLLPILFVAAISLLISFVVHKSSVNMNNRDSAYYENNLLRDNYPYKKDLNYKRKIINDAEKYSLADLDFIVGPQELEHFLQNYNDDFSFYAYDKYNPPKNFHLTEKKLRANLNLHSLISDGNMNIKDILNEAADYADAVSKEYPGQYYLLAITDLNTIAGCKYIIDTVTSNKDKYKNLKIVLGVEIPTTMQPNDKLNQSSKVNILALCINPFDKKMKKEFSGGFLGSSKNKERYFDETTDFLNSQENLVYGIAKPLQEDSGSFRQNILNLDGVLTHYVNKCPNAVKFVEAYYSPYIYHRTPETNYMFEISDILNLYKIGSLELMSDSIFNPY